MLLARLMQLACRGQQSSSPSELAKLAHSCRDALPPRKRGQEEIGAELGCRQRNLSSSLSRCLQCLGLVLPRSAIALWK